MKARPLLFSGAMVRALLAGQKTQTRRALNPQPSTVVDGQIAYASARPGYARALTCPYGGPGDLLWVKETWQTQEAFDALSPTEIGETWAEEYGSPWCPIRFLADGKCEGSVEQWQESPAGKTRVSIHMPRWASRLTLKITGVRVERLQDISEDDAKAEGVEPPTNEREEHDWAICPECGGTGLHGALGENLGYLEVDCTTCDTHAKRYRHLWEHINGAGSWDANPFVWVIEFEVVH